MKFLSFGGLFLGGVLATAEAKTLHLHSLHRHHPVKTSFSPIVKKVAPAVVNIYTTQFPENPMIPLPFLQDPFFREFQEEALRVKSPSHQHIKNSLGSGVILRKDGLIITNYHIIQNAQEIRVFLFDRREFQATVQEVDPEADLAILKISTGDEKIIFPFLELGDADDLQVGDFILAIGNPFGVGQTVTNGIVSAVNRTQFSKEGFRTYIQTDAAINPGNSGGALVNLEGYLVGINTAIYSKTGLSIGIGFATPTNLVLPLLAHLGREGKGIRAWTGLTTTSLTPDLARRSGLKSLQGAVIKEIDPQGPGALGGLRVGDIILKINGHLVQDAGSFRFRVATLFVGDVVECVVRRQQREKNVFFKTQSFPHGDT